MPADRFTLLFDLAQAGFRTWTFSAFGMLFVVTGAGMLLAGKLRRMTGIPYRPLRSSFRRYFPYFYFGFAVLWTVAAFLSTYTSYRHHLAVLQTGECQTVEGVVADFRPLPASGHGMEAFRVEDVWFRYSDYIVTDGFNVTSRQGGPIGLGHYVRICYDPADHQILRLEIRDFQGIPPETGARALFAFPRHMLLSGARAGHVPLFSGAVLLFVLLGLLDWLALWALFLPYLRRWFRLETQTMTPCAVPPSLAAGTRIRLRNCLVTLDAADGALWVRPRGFNGWQVPQTAARLLPDASGRWVAREIRFSSGAPVILLAFFLGAYRFFGVSLDFPAAAPPVWFLCLGAGLFLVAGFFQMRRYCRFMGLLVEEVCEELRGMGPP